MTINPEKIAHEILGIEIDHPNGGTSDNLAIMLCSFFEESIFHPEDRTIDEYDCWTQWASDQVNLVEKAIAQVISKALEKHDHPQ